MTDTIDTSQITITRKTRGKASRYKPRPARPDPPLIKLITTSTGKLRLMIREPAPRKTWRSMPFKYFSLGTYKDINEIMLMIPHFTKHITPTTPAFYIEAMNSLMSFLIDYELSTPTISS